MIHDQRQSFISTTLWAIYAGVLALTLMCVPALAQNIMPLSKPSAHPFAPELLAPQKQKEEPEKLVVPPISYDPLSGYQGASLAPSFGTNVLPYAPGSQQQNNSTHPESQATLYLVAKLAKDLPNLTKGVEWRVYSTTEKDGEGNYKLLQTAADRDAEFRLSPGTYLVHTAYGQVSTVTRYKLKTGVTTGTILLNAGGFRLDAAFSDKLKVPSQQLRFDIYDMTYDAEGNRTKIASNIKPGELVAVAAGTYQVVSRYGSLNAQIRADLHVQAGKLTEAMLYMEAGNVTLKLINQSSGTSLANTAWTVMSPGGDIITSGIGAYLDVTLASGTYEVLAENQGNTYRDSFTVNTGDFQREVAIKAAIN